MLSTSEKKCKLVNGDQTEFVMIGQPTLPFFLSWTYLSLSIQSMQNLLEPLHFVFWVNMYTFIKDWPWFHIIAREEIRYSFHI